MIDRKKWPGSVTGIFEFAETGFTCIYLMVSRATRILSGGLESTKLAIIATINVTD